MILTLCRHIHIFTCNSVICLSGYGSTGPGYVSGTGYGVPPPQISTGYGAPTAPSGLYGAPFKISARGSSGKTASQTTKSSSSREYDGHFATAPHSSWQFMQRNWAVIHGYNLWIDLSHLTILYQLKQLFRFWRCRMVIRFGDLVIIG